MRQRPGEVNLQIDPRRVEIRRQVADPAHHRVDIPLFRQRLRPDLRVPGADLTGGKSVADRLRPQLLPGKPATGAFVQPANILLAAALQAREQRVAHQRMVAKPQPTLVEGGKKQVALRNPCQHRLAVSFACDGVAQRRMQAIEHRRLQEKVEHLGGQRGKNNFVKIAGN